MRSQSESLPIRRGLPAAADANRFDAIAEQREHGRQQGERRDHGGEHDGDRADADAAEDRVRQQQHAEQRQHDRDPAEQHRLARGRTGATDRVELLEPAGALLAVARDDEQGIVDADREADHRDDLGDDEREVEREADQGGSPQRGGDRHDAEHDRDQPGHDRAEHEHHDDEGHEDADRLALLQPFLREGDDLVLQRRRTGHHDLEACGHVDVIDGGEQLVGVFDDGCVIGARHRHRQQRRPSRLRDRTVIGEEAADVAHDPGPEGLDLALQVADEAAHVGVGHGAVAGHDDELGLGLGASQALLEHRGGPLRLGVVGEVLSGGEGIAEERRRQHAGRDQRCDPGDHGPPWMARGRPGERSG